MTVILESLLYHPVINRTNQTMATLQTFNRNMIEKYLKSKELNYFRDSDDDLLIQIGYDDDYGCKLTFYFMISGTAENIYAIRVFSDKRIPKSDWGRAIMLCNTWNQEKRWPKAFLDVKKPDSDTTATIQLNYDIDLQQGIHQELFDDMTETIIRGGMLFWEWAHKEQGF